MQAWLSSVEAAELHISVLVVGEIRQGIDKLERKDPDQAKVFADWLERVRSEYSDRVLPVGTEVAEEWGRMNASRPVPVVDGLMAATAKVAGLTFVTRNTKDVTGLGVRLLDPFEAPPPTA